MTDFRTNMTSVAAVDDSIVLAYDKQFQISLGQEQVLEQVVLVKKDIAAKSIDMPIYARMTDVVTPLVDKAVADAVAQSDTKITMTPAEYGNFTTTTLLANLQTGGMVDLATAKNIGLNAASSQDALIVAALAAGTTASSNILTVDGGAEGSLTDTDVMSGVFLSKMYNKLNRAHVPKIGGYFVAVMHDDCIHDLRNGSDAGSWTDVLKYSNSVEVLNNEVGAFKGFRIVSYSKDALITDGGGNSTVDSYASYFLGANAVGKAVSHPTRFFAEPDMADPYKRFANIGWYGVFQYKALDAACLWKGICASSVGANS